jgi:hypothetical protein
MRALIHVIPDQKTELRLPYPGSATTSESSFSTE